MEPPCADTGAVALPGTDARELPPARSRHVLTAAQAPRSGSSAAPARPSLPRRCLCRCRCRRSPAAASVFAVQLVLATAVLPLASAALASAGYDPWEFNKVVRYSASSIPAAVFRGGVDAGVEYLFPLETNRVVSKYSKPWQACFGPQEVYDVKAIVGGTKLPCRYWVNPDGTYEYEEEHAAEILLKSNCYCYAIDRFVGSYCEPGLGGTGQSFELPVLDCSKPTAGVIADGGTPVDRATVYNNPRPERGHYIALAVKPPSSSDDSGDFHFWRLDSNGAWSYKAGDTLVRNTLRNGTPIRDIENDRAARGIYSRFCGYFHVVPETHKLVGNHYWYSRLPNRYAQWRYNGIKSKVTPLPQVPAAWLAAYRDYFAESGWEDARAKESAAPAPSAEDIFLQASAAGADGGGGDGAASAGAAAAGGGTQAYKKEAAFAPRLASARAPAAPLVVPHWYSVRPPGIASGGGP